MKHALRAPAHIELKGDEADPAEIVTKAIGDLSNTIDGRFSKLEAKAAELEVAMKRPLASNDNQNADAIERKAFDAYARHGAERMAAEELKALTVSTDSAGGFLAPEQFGNEILKALVQFSPIRQYAKVVQIGAAEIKYPKRTGTTEATWVGETDDRTGSQPSFGQLTIAPFELATFTDVSTQLLEDNAYNLEGELMADFAESFGKAEASAFVNGTGTGQPKGVMKASGIAEVKTGHASAFPTSNPADVIIGIYHALPNTFAQNAVWAMNRNTLAVVRKWKDADGRYVLAEPISSGMPMTLLGRPVVEMIDMDDLGADKFPIIFGDFSGFRIVDRVGLSILRDPFSLATKGQVRFHARRRTGSELTHADRFVKLKCAV